MTLRYFVLPDLVESTTYSSLYFRISRPEEIGQDDTTQFAFGRYMRVGTDESCIAINGEDVNVNPIVKDNINNGDLDDTLEAVYPDPVERLQKTNLIIESERVQAIDLLPDRYIPTEIDFDSFESQGWRAVE